MGQLPKFDERLFRMVERGAADIPDFPDDCLNNLTHIEERALDLIWKNETASDDRLPQDVVNYWTANPAQMRALLLPGPLHGSRRSDCRD